MTDHPVGASIPRLEVREKVTGRAQFTDDLHRPGMLYGAILPSPHAHARILSYDTSRARALPGVMAALTGDDVPWSFMGPFIKDETALAKGKVRYAGEPVAAVAALDPDTARRAVRLIEVTYEVLPAVFSPEEALAPGAPIIHENFERYFKTFQSAHGANLMATIEIAEGDVARTWPACDVVVEGVFETQAQYHAYMEPCAALAEVDASGKVTVWSANQSVFRVQANVSESLGIPMARIRSVTPRVGGAFGGKMESTVQPVTVALALATSRPVKLTLSREQDFQMVRSRHPVRMHMKTGARKDGTLLAREADLVLDAGAYADDSPGVAGICALFACGPYQIENVHFVAKAVYTNKLRAGAFRGFGGPQVSFAGESQIDEIAERLGLDPIEIRVRNAVRAGRTWLCGITLPRDAFVECLTRVRHASNWDRRRHASGGSPGKRLGIGIGCLPHISGILSSGAIIRILEDGTAVLNTGAVDNGQGSDTVLVQICAAALGLGIDQVSLATPDTDAAPYNWGTTASRVTYMAGRAIVAAADSVARQLKKVAGEMMECAQEDLDLRPGGWIGVRGVPERQLSFGAISARCHWVSGGPIIGSASFAYDGPPLDPKRAVINGFPFGRLGAWMFGAQVVEVEVDEGTGKVRPLRVWAAHDLGRAINPRAAEGQIEGGVVQGLGYALSEELIWEEGRLKNPTLMEYKIPGAPDVPQITPILVEDPEPTGPFGAKGIGEPPLVGVAAAVANAVAHATGIRLRRLPMTAERVLRALREQRGERARR